MWQRDGHEKSFIPAAVLHSEENQTWALQLQTADDEESWILHKKCTKI